MSCYCFSSPVHWVVHDSYDYQRNDLCDETDEQTEQLTTEPESPNGDAPVGDGEGEG